MTPSNSHFMKRFITLILFFIVCVSAGAQQFNNEWIKHAQTYYKFKVGATGLYRIPKSALDNAGIGNVDVRFFELWRNGKKTLIYPSVPSGPLPSDGFIEFWGEKNDGGPDKELYRNPTYQHSDKLSFFTDTAVYFLSVNTNQSGAFYTARTNDLSGPLPSAEPYFMHKAATYFNAKMNFGFAAVVGQYVYSSSFDKGEFWSSANITPAAPLSVNNTNLQVYAGGPDATLRFGVMGDALNSRRIKVSVNNNEVIDTAVDYFNEVLTTVPVPLSYINSGSATIKYQNVSAVSTDRFVSSFYELTYPRLFNFDNQKSFRFSLPASGSGYYLEISNFNYGTTAPVLYDLANGERITADIATPGLVRVVLGAAGQRDLVLTNEETSNINIVGSLTPKTFRRFQDLINQGDYLIITHASLLTGTHGNNPVEEYKNYRSSAEGGGYEAQVVDIDELVDQFAFGVNKHPSSIRNFLRYARATFATAPKFVFLIGHGITYYDYRRNETGVDVEKLNLVPTFGYPASDNLLSADGLTSPIAVTPIGRLSAINGKEVEDYLEKIKGYELTQKTSANTLAGREWMKNIVHVTGASDPYLGVVLCNYMSVYRQLVEDTLFGGNVYSFCKNTAVPDDQNNSNRIAKLFEEGISILNYFGHSSATTLEFNLDNPESYNNEGKYPVFFVNGCYAGNFFAYNAQRAQQHVTLSERFVLAKQRGSIAFVASTHYGIVNYLNLYLKNMYSSISKVDFGKTLGEITRDAMQQMINAAGPSDYYARLHAEEIAIHGDPAIYMNGQPKPDYVVEDAQVKINPSFISIAEDAFDVKVRMVNIGRAVKDSIVVELSRQYPDGITESIYRGKIRGIRYADSITLSVPINPNRDKGLNKIIVDIDADNAVDEISETNNKVTKEFFIFEDEARPVYPYNYAIINTPTSKLYASTANPFSPQKNYVMEMDTTALFDSPLKISKTIASVGGVLEFDPGISYKDSVVYYWRVAIVPASGGSYIWNTSSFTYINGDHEGYNQSHYFQHAKSETQRLALDTMSREWKYGKRSTSVFIRNGVFPTGASGESELNVTINDNPYIASACVGNSIVFNVFDPVSFKPWSNVGPNGENLYKSGSGSANCGFRRYYNFEFSYMTPASRRLIMNFMDSIPTGFYVIARSMDKDIPNSYSATWRGDTTYNGGSYSSLYHRLLAEGMMNIDSMYKPRAWIFMYQKGGESFTPLYYQTDSIFDRGKLAATVYTPDTLGYITSPVFGPAKEWKDVIWNGVSLEDPSTDNPSVDIIGIDAHKNETLLHTLPRNVQSFDISSVSVADYPFMKLRMRNIDSVSLTPFQLKSWKVYYTAAPEGMLAPNLALTAKDTLEVGETLKFSIAFKNVSKHPFDSVAVKVIIVDNNNTPHTISLPRQKPLVSGDTLMLRFEIDTKEYPGSNSLFVDLNPDDDQPELYHFNNFLYHNFFVKTDLTNPLLDVTFDGVHIMNRDLVSARPHIQIKLKDEAKFLLLNDTALSSVQIRYPDGTLRTYHFDNDTLSFIPASSGSDNTATIDFRPSFSQQYDAEGDEYELIVKGKDRSGNKAGQNEYRVSFTVISKPMISNLLNYPNPFSTSTAFVFTITGSEIPQNMKIQVLTVTGKVVREITKEELGPIHIGRNITEFKWDGTDQFGQKLANGVYLYRFVTTLNGRRMEKYKAKNDNTDVFFNNGYGKMYLMR